MAQHLIALLRHSSRALRSHTASNLGANLIRCLIVEAGTLNAVALDRISFKGTVDSVRQFSLARPVH